jgi:hypothetical protein
MKKYENRISEISQSGKEKDAICSEFSCVSGGSLTKKNGATSCHNDLWVPEEIKND